MDYKDKPCNEGEITAFERDIELSRNLFCRIHPRVAFRTLRDPVTI